MLDTTVGPAVPGFGPPTSAESFRAAAEIARADAAGNAGVAGIGEADRATINPAPLAAEPDVFHPNDVQEVRPQSAAAAAFRFPSDAAAADLAALALRAALDRLSGALARAASAFVALRAWTVFGFARLDDHARERCGRSGRWFRDLAALGDGIAAVPRLAEALSGSDGRRPLGRVAATLVARAVAQRLSAGPEAAEGWIAAARSLSVRDLRTAIRTARMDTGDGVQRSWDGVQRGSDADDAASDCSTLRGFHGVADDGSGPVAGLHAAVDMETAADPDADRVLLRLPVPSAMLAAFDEALDLHRAVEGHAFISEFVEALIGEALSGSTELPPGFVQPLEHGTPEAQCEAALRRASAAWSSLPEPLPAPRASLGDLVACFHGLEAVAGEGDAIEIDRQVRALIGIETALESELGRLLAFMTERRDWVRLQFAGVGHYAEERLGMSRSRAGERARLALALRGLPAVADACCTGRISMEAAALIHRILSDHACSEDLETAWVEHAATVTIKRMRDEARALGRYRARCYGANAAPLSEDSSEDPNGADPAHPPRPLADPRWTASLRREAGTAVRRISEFGLIAAGFSPSRRAADPESGSESTEPDVFQAQPAPRCEPDVFHALLPEPDATLRLRLPADVAADFLAAIESARATVEARVALVPWDAPWPAKGEPGTAPLAGPPAAEWAARVAFIRGRRVPTWVGLLAMLQDFAATWDTDACAPERRDDQVFIRDGWRCMAPGCSSRRNLEDHHIVYRSRGGDDHPSNRVALCRFHHQRGEHGDLMSVRGAAPGALTWRLGRPDVAVMFRSERRGGDRK